MQRAAQTFHLATSDGWRTVAAGTELADDDPAVMAGPQYFVPIEPTASEPAPTKTTRRAKSSKGQA